MKNATCTTCEREMIPSRLWTAADKGDRDQWRREGKRRGKGSRCHSCVNARHWAKVATPRVCRTCSTEVPARRLYCDPCRDERRDAALTRHRLETAAARSELRARGREQQVAAMLTLRGEGLTNAEIAARLDTSPASVRSHIGTQSAHESPTVLTEGRWVTGRGPSGLPIKVWEAA